MRGKIEYHFLDMTEIVNWDVVYDESAENPVEPAEGIAYHVYLDGADNEEQAEVSTEVVALHLAYDEAAGGGRWGVVQLQGFLQPRP